MPVDNPGNTAGGDETNGVETRQNVERAALRVLAQADSLLDAAPEILKGICRALDWDVGVMWVANDAELRCEAVWSADPAASARFAAAARESTFTRGVGIPGRVWEQAEPVWIPDVMLDRNFPRAPFADEDGIHGAVGIPLATKDRTLGVMEFFSRSVQEPDADLLEMLEAIGSHVGDQIESERLAQELLFQKALLESQGEASLDGILLVSAEQRVLYWNSRLVDMWGISEDVLRQGDVFEVNAAMARKLEDPAVFDEIVSAVREDPALSRRDVMVLRDGRVFDRWTAPVRAADGRRLGRTVNHRDITHEKRIEEALRATEQWSAFISETTTVLSESLDVSTIIDRLAELAVPGLGDWSSVHLIDRHGTPQRLAVAHSDAAKVDLARRMLERYPPDPMRDGGVYEVVRTRSPLLIPVITDEMLALGTKDEQHLLLMQQLAPRSLMIVPIVCRDRVLGAITFIRSETDHVYGEADLAAAMEFASRAAFPIDNARLYAETRIVAQTLQKSFLPPDLPAVPGVDISARYFPAGEEQEIGGDFYDAFPIDSKRFGFVLGDVSGKGLEAATVTTLARHTIRGAALTADRPSDALRVLNQALLEERQTDRFCTAVYAIVEPRFGRVRVTVSSGGHPPPYVVRNDGSVEAVDCGGTLLGFIENIALRDASFDLEFGDKLFLYTDGVLDIRQKSGMFGQEGLEKLLHECAKRGTEGAAEYIATTLSEIQDGASTDDIAFILLGVRSSIFNIQSRRGARLDDERSDRG